MNNESDNINHLCRYTISFIFFYHGLVPKIVFLSPVEQQLVNAHFPNQSTALISVIGGISEIILALCIIRYKRSLIPILIAAATLILLLIDVMVVMPELLIAAFNPVSINVTTLVLCYLVYITQPVNKNQNE